MIFATLGDKKQTRRQNMAEIVFSWGVSEIKCIIFKENNDNPQWRKFTFSGGGAKSPKFPTKLSNFRHTPPPQFALEKTVFSPLLGQNFRKFENFP